MADSKNPIEELELRRTWVQQVDGVIKEFRRLVIDCQVPLARLEACHEQAFARFLNVKTQNEMIVNSLLRWRALPLLHNLILDLSRLLNPSDLQQKEPESRIKLIADWQPRLESILGFILTISRWLCPQTTSEPYRTDDQFHNGVKSYRLQRLKATLSQAHLDISRCCNVACDLLEHSKQSGQVSQYQRDTYVRVLRFTNQAVKSIRDADECMRGSELDVVEASWREQIDRIDGLFRDIVAAAASEHDSLTTIGIQPAQYKLILDGRPFLKIVKSAIPMIKISKLLFTKISKRGMNRKRLAFSTEMCSDQIKSLEQMASYVFQDLTQLFSLLRRAHNGAQAPLTSRDLIVVARRLQSRFEAPLAILLLYLIPAIPDTNGFPLQTYYKDWLVTWNTQRILATRNFINAARLVDTHSL
ncbi:hypothetical protein PGT21_025433 [Puccinia graminis f. sp. tritici]|uniref:Uncharacterized protein n=1 Tax=Puccinia graminis f. sp. tritici TaxID=56615 RepID=A0A5B0PYQ8_PUCGR|nr:hypothetical protein PGT21_025433 [Puccinia graminis f. sp. tritici]KAA1120950.1 hypothetical protein PGTUg99_021885 [Puccinia graminis f. sp. tritici]